MPPHEQRLFAHAPQLVGRSTHNTKVTLADAEAVLQGQAEVDRWFNERAVKPRPQTK